MSETRQQANVMISYLFQVMYERGEQLRKSAGPRDANDHAKVILSLSRSISILREDYGMYDRAPEPQPEPDEEPAPQTEPAEWDQERTEDEPDDAPTETEHE